MQRPYRLISGLAYPKLEKADTQATAISSDLDDPNSFYYDPSLKLSEKDMEQFVGKPICVEHKKELDVGKITAVWKDSKGNMRMNARIYTDNATQDIINDRINRKLLEGLSVGYESAIENGHVVAKKANEISLCKRGFFPDASVCVAATDSGKRYYKNSGAICFKIHTMASENSAVPPPAAPEAAGQKDAMELVRLHDEQLKKSEELAAQLAKLQEAHKIAEERNAKFEEAEKERIKAYGEQQKPILEEVLALQEEQFKEEMGAEAVYPEEMRAATERAFMDPAAAHMAAPIKASAMNYKKRKAAEAEQRAKNEELAAKLKEQQTANETAYARAQVNASRSKMHEATNAAAEDTESRRVAVNASEKTDFSSLFYPAPSDINRELMARDYPAQFGAQSTTVGVNASANDKAKAPPPAPWHPNVDKLRNSPRFHAPHLFNLAITMSKCNAFAHMKSRECVFLDQ